MQVFAHVHDVCVGLTCSAERVAQLAYAKVFSALVVNMYVVASIYIHATMYNDIT